MFISCLVSIDSLSETTTLMPLKSNDEMHACSMRWLNTQSQNTREKVRQLLNHILKEWGFYFILNVFLNSKENNISDF